MPRASAPHHPLASDLSNKHVEHSIYTITAAEPTNSFDFSEALNDPFLNMTTVYRNAAAVAEERVLELTQQWENTLRSMKPSEITGAIFASSSTSTTKGNKEEKYPYPESAQAESGGDGKRSG